MKYSGLNFFFKLKEWKDWSHLNSKQSAGSWGELFRVMQQLGTEKGKQIHFWGVCM